MNWSVSADGNACSGTNCAAAGTTDNQFYITLAKPSGLYKPWATAIYLAVVNGGATNKAQAFQNTWAAFAAPNRATNPNSTPYLIPWTGVAMGSNFNLTYYPQDVPAGACATDISQLLNTPNGGGQCSSFALLFMWSLAMNGLDVWTSHSCDKSGNTHDVSMVEILPTVQNEWMLVKKWKWVDNPTQKIAGYPLTANFNQSVDPMVPTRNASGSGLGWGDLLYLSGIPGQSNSDPAEKLFKAHYIVGITNAELLQNCTVCGPYFDPSYGVTYLSDSEFQGKALTGYALDAGSNPDLTNPPTEYWAVRLTGETVDVSLKPTATCAQ